MVAEQGKYCAKCGSDNRKMGKLYRKGTLDNILFHEDDAPRMSFKKEVAALTCMDCGYIELFLSHFEL